MSFYSPIPKNPQQGSAKGIIFTVNFALCLRLKPETVKML